MTNGKTYIRLMISLLLCQHVSVNMWTFASISHFLLHPSRHDRGVNSPRQFWTLATYIPCPEDGYAWITSRNLHILTETCRHNNKDIISLMWVFPFVNLLTILSELFPFFSLIIGLHVDVNPLSQVTEFDEDREILTETCSHNNKDIISLM